MVLENVKEMWTEKPKGSKGKGVNKDRFISKMYVRDSAAICYPYRLSGGSAFRVFLDTNS
jgi:ABC-type histidine transport system ATPase subunit